MPATQHRRPQVMGVLNVTPDSFSDGGRYFDFDLAVARGRAMAAEGVDVVDVGGESSRPGASPVPTETEMQRVVPVIEALSPLVRVSVDTVKPEVARAAVAAGATMLNDVSASLWTLAAELGVGWVAMHRRGTPSTMDAEAHYDDVVAEVRRFVLDRAAAAAEAGVPEIWVDPGIGFAKTQAHNLQILVHLGELVSAATAEGWGVLVGTSRKRFLGTVSVRPGAPARGVDDRLEETLATSVWAASAGAGMVRVHDVGPAVEAMALLGPPAWVPAAVPGAVPGPAARGAAA